jgi:hypothetical protein
LANERYETLMSEDYDSNDGPTPPFRDDEWIREPLADMKRREAQEMPAWFIPALVGTLCWMGLFIWLAVEVNWPEAYGFRGACVHRGCLFESVLRSPVLLKNPTSYSVALFAWFMATDGAIVAAVLYSVIRRPSRRSFFQLAVIVALGVLLALLPVSEWDV